nr:enoyl-CoA hydratase-related protein [Roseateles koreensis]
MQLSVSAHGVAHLTMNRPEVFNAFDETMIAELGQAIAQCSANPQVRVVVLAGAGKVFSAGADVQWMKRAAQATQAWNEQDARSFAETLSQLAACSKPTIARVHGLALGGGVGLVAACDVAVASTETRLAVSEARLGILPAVIGPHLINAVGLRQARRLALTASRITAADALAMGLLHEVVAIDALDTAVQRWVDELLLSGPQAQAEIKRLFGQLAPGPLTAEVRELTAQTIARVRVGGEAREGFAAFLDKRAPAWAPSISTSISTK